MKVSELIEKLSEVLAKDGDLHVSHLSYEETYTPVVSVDVLELAFGEEYDAHEDLVCVLNQSLA